MPRPGTAFFAADYRLTLAALPAILIPAIPVQMTAAVVLTVALVTFCVLGFLIAFFIAKPAETPLATAPIPAPTLSNLLEILEALEALSFNLSKFDPTGGFYPVTQLIFWATSFRFM